MVAWIKRDAETWCHGRLWQVRAPLLGWLLWILVYLWSDPELHERGLFDFPNLFQGINLGIHELGHVIFSPFGMFLGILGGSLTQVLAPLIGIVVIWRSQRDYFGAAVVLGWVGISLFEVAVYMADAKLRRLTLVSPFSSHPIHDWDWLFRQMGMLDSALTIAFLTKLLASLIVLAAVALGGWLLWKMHEHADKPAKYVGSGWD